MSKHELLKNFIIDLLTAQVLIDVIAIQETWSINYLELVNILVDFLVFKNLSSAEEWARGGGGVLDFMLGMACTSTR